MEFSVTECMNRLNIKEGTKMDKMQSLYCNLDRLVLNERGYLKECMFERSFEQAEDVERDVFRGILLRAVKMGIESELGGAIKQETSQGDEVLQNAGELNENGVSGSICWAACPEGDFKFVMFQTINEAQKKQMRSSIENDRANFFNLFGKKHTNRTDNLRQFDIECDCMDLDQVSVCARTSYLKGLEMNLKMASKDDEVLQTLENEWQTYQEMTPAERIADFNRFVVEIRYVNGLEPRPITRHNDNKYNDNQNQRG